MNTSDFPASAENAGFTQSNTQPITNTQPTSDPYPDTQTPTSSNSEQGGEKPPEIHYINTFTQARNTAKSMTHAKLDRQSPKAFTHGLAEMVPMTGNCRLYMDVELNEYKEGWLAIIVQWLDELAEICDARYAACGYINNSDFWTEYTNDANAQCSLMLAHKDDENIKHAISFHVIYQKAFDRKDLFKVLGNASLITVPEGVDMSVYKKEDKQQLIRHPFATKWKTQQDVCHTEIDFTSLKQLYKASELVVTPDGSEEVGTLDELKEMFKYDGTASSTQTSTQTSSQTSTVKRTKSFSDPMLAQQAAKRAEKDAAKKAADDIAAKAEKEVDELLHEDVTDYEILLRYVVNPSFKHDTTVHDMVAFIPKSKNKEINNGFLTAFNKLYNSVPHKTPEDIEKSYDKLKDIHGFCSCMSNIKSTYYETIADLEDVKEMTKMYGKPNVKLDAVNEVRVLRYLKFTKAYHNIIKHYFDSYDYIHTTANEEKFMKKCADEPLLSTTYKKLYVRKILYIANEKYLYRKTLHETQSKALDSKAFQIYLKRLCGFKKIDESLNNNLKMFHKEDMLETSDGLVYPRYRDLDFKTCLTGEEFNHFKTAYQATFKEPCCADFAFYILIQDIASGFHDNSGIIKFYYGTGGNNKDCETCIYENIIGSTDLIFKTSKFDVLADEKNIKVVSSLYVQFNEMPNTSRERFNELINALKNYNECGKQRTRGLYQDFVTINCNIRFQCNTNHPILRDWLLDGANDAIKRRFLVAERVHSDEHSDWLYDFCHNEERCRALKMYIKAHKDDLYPGPITTIHMLQFFKDHEDIYAKYTEAKANDEFEELKEALCNSGCIKGKRTPDSDDEYIVNIKDWYKQYVGDNRKKCLESTFRSKIGDYVDYVKHCYIGKDRKSNKYFITNTELIDALSNNTPSIDIGEN